MSTYSRRPTRRELLRQAVALASLVLWSAPAHWLQRLAGALGVSLALGGVIGLATGQVAMFTVIGADFLIQSLMLFVWLAAGAILPTKAFAVTDPTLQNL